MKKLNFMYVTMTTLLVLTSNAFVLAQDTIYPADAGLVNVETYGAYGNDQVDDTAAIRNAVNAAAGYQKFRTVYFPKGTYLVNDTIVLTTPPTTGTGPALQRAPSLQGESRTETIIKLADQSSGYNELNSSGNIIPKAIIKTFQGNTTQAFTNANFASNICNLTINVGSGNPGAVGIVYMSHNQGTVRDVTIRSSDSSKRGHTGLDMSLETIPGPALVKDVLIDGFEYGIKLASHQYSMTFENITLRNQSQVGFYNSANIANIRKLFSDQPSGVPAFRQVVSNQSKGMVTLIDSSLTSTAPSTTHAAIEIDDGYVFVRNTQATGYVAAVSDRGTQISTADSNGQAYVNEYLYGKAYGLGSTPVKPSMSLEIKETPQVAWDNPSRRCIPAGFVCPAGSTCYRAPSCSQGTWANVRDFGATQDASTDDTAAIQAAIDSGATTIYFPNTIPSGGDYRYIITNTLTVDGNVRRLIGFNSRIAPIGSLGSNGGAVLKFINSNHSIRVIENFVVQISPSEQTKAHFIEHASSQTLVAKHLLLRRGYAYRNTADGVGDLYIEDVHVLATNPEPVEAGFIFKNQRVWARQINPEKGEPEIINDGSALWILGLKSEVLTTKIETKNSGRTEVLGGLTVTGGGGSTNNAAFINSDSSVSIIFAKARQDSDNGVFTNVIQEGATNFLTASQFPSRKAKNDNSQAFVIPLYTNYVTTARDVSDELSVTRSGFRYVYSTKRYVQTLTIANNNSVSVGGPFSLVLDRLSTNATLFDPTGTTRFAVPAGSPYVDFTAGGNGLQPGESVTLTLEFTNPLKREITYGTRILTGNNSR